MNNQNLIEQNEIQVNESLHNICKKLYIAIPILFVCRLVNLFSLDWPVMLIALSFGFITLSVPVFAGKFVKPTQIKWFIVVDYVLFAVILNSLVYGVTLLLFMLPLAIGALYYNVQLIKSSIWMVIVGVLLAEIGGSLMVGEYKAEFQWIPMHMIMLIFQMIVLGAVLAQLAKRTFYMLHQSQKLNESIQEHFETNRDISMELGESITKVNINVGQSNDGILNVSDSIRTIAEGSKVIVEVAKETEEIVDHTVHRISEAAKQTEKINQLTAAMESVTSQNKENLMKFNKATQQIRSKTDYSKVCMQQLEEKIQVVHKTTQLIGSISSQTEMLALNASIEAARSGEAGKGFAVIAEQVKILASQAAECNKQISDLIETVSNDSKEVVTSIEENYREVEQSVNYIGETKESFEYFLEVQRNMAEQITSISHTIYEFIEESNTIQAHIQELLSMNAVNSNQILEIEKAVYEIREKSANISTSMIYMEQQAKELVK